MTRSLQDVAPGVRLLIVGAMHGPHLGLTFRHAAVRLGIEHDWIDTKLAQSGSRWLTAASWRLRDRRPVRMRSFEAHLLAKADEFRPTVVLTTGAAPVSRTTVARIRMAGAKCLNLSTDDPWSPVGISSWFLDSLAEYDAVFTPRRANLQELCALGGPVVQYLPFGYDLDRYFPEVLPDDEQRAIGSDILFVGGADKDRLPIVRYLLSTKLNVALYGSYWERHREVRSVHRGTGSPDTVRRATCAAKLCLCLVRRSNRDGHVMRTMEMAACGAAMLVEDTQEHRALLGPDREAVWYFNSPEEMRDLAVMLANDESERTRLRHAVYRRIADGSHTYDARLRTMLGVVDESHAAPPAALTCTDTPMRNPGRIP